MRRFAPDPSVALGFAVLRKTALVRCVVADELFIHP